MHTNTHTQRKKSEKNCFTEGENGKNSTISKSHVILHNCRKVYLVRLTKSWVGGGWGCWRSSHCEKGKAVLFGKYHILKHRWQLELNQRQTLYWKKSWEKVIR